VTNLSVLNPIIFSFCSFSLIIRWNTISDARSVLAIPDVEEAPKDGCPTEAHTMERVTDVRDGVAPPLDSPFLIVFMTPGLKKLNCAFLSQE